MTSATDLEPRTDKWFYRLPARLLHAFYRGQGQIAAFRSEIAPGAHPDASEDWIGSIVEPFGRPGEQLAEIAPGLTLRAAVTEDPTRWFGRPDRSVESIPLVKLLDTGQRIPVHVHPDRHFATTLGMANGKSEDWIVLHADPGATAHLGWREPIHPETLRQLVDAQDVPGMLSRMNRVELTAGDSIFVPAGIVHSIGAGILVNEVQEAADASCLLEYTEYTTGSAQDSFLGLDRQRALEMVTLEATTTEQLSQLVLHQVHHEPGVMIPPAATKLFSADCLAAGSTRAPAFGIFLVLSGSGAVTSQHGTHGIGAGDAFTCPHAAGQLTITGNQHLRVAAFGPPA